MAEEEEHPTIADLPDVDAESLALALSLHRELNAPTRRIRREQPEDAPVARKRPSSAKKAKRANKEEDSEAKSGDTGDGKDDDDDDMEEDSADAKDNKDGDDDEKKFLKKKEKKKKREKLGIQLEDQGERPKSASKRKAKDPDGAKESKKAAKLKVEGNTKQEEEGGGGGEEAPKKKRRKKEPANDSNQIDTTRIIKKQQPSPANIKPSRAARTNKDDSKDLTNIQQDRIGGDDNNGDGGGDMTALAGASPTIGAILGKPRGRPPGRSKASKKEGTSNKGNRSSKGVPEHVGLAAEHRKLAAASSASLLAEGTIKCFLAGHESSMLLERTSFSDKRTLAASLTAAFGGGGGGSGEKVEVKEMVFLNAKGEAVALENDEAWQDALAVFKAVAVYIVSVKQSLHL